MSVSCQPQPELGLVLKPTQLDLMNIVNFTRDSYTLLPDDLKMRQSVRVHMTEKNMNPKPIILR